MQRALRPFQYQNINNAASSGVILDAYRVVLGAYYEGPQPETTDERNSKNNNNINIKRCHLGDPW